jgi:hypothetical protein
MTAPPRTSVVPAPVAPVALPETDSEWEPRSPTDADWGDRDRPSRMDDWLPVSPPGAGVSPIAMPITDEGPPGDDDPGELEARARRLAVRPDHLREAMATFRAALVIDPSRVSALEGLLDTAERAGALAEATISRALLAMVDPGKGPGRALHIDAQAIAVERDVLLRHPGHEAARKLLGIVWESALPLFRLTLQQIGVVGTDRVSAHTGSPIGRALAAALDALPDDDATVFAARRPGITAIPVRVQPPAVLVGAGAPSDEPSLRFLVGRALELARPEHVLVATLPEDECRTLFAALHAAFGPTEAAQVSRPAAALAQKLWHTMPARTQRPVRELLVRAEGTWSYDALAASIFGGAARAGLVASGDLGASLRALAKEHEGGAPLRFEGARNWADAMSRSGALADLASFAFGDAFVQAVRGPR